MRNLLVPLALAALSASAGSAAAQTLVCPPAAAGGSPKCDVFHYHVALYRPDIRQIAPELDAVNQFASQAACDRARDAEIARNLAVVDQMKRVRNENAYEPDRFGPCHCDLTLDRMSSVYRSDAQRMQQLRTMAEVRQRVRERLLDAGLTSDSELVRGLSATPSASGVVGAPRLTQIPQPSAPANVANSADDLKLPKMSDTPQTAAAANLPLVDVLAPAGAAPVVAAMPPAAPAPAATAAASPAPAPADVLPTVVVENPAPAPAPAPVATTAEAAPAPAPQTAEATTPPEPETPAEDIAEAFVSYETQRITKVLQASDAVADDNLKARILEACTQRIQLLSNLRALIQGSGIRSRLAVSALGAKNEPERLALVAKLFGSDMPAHWAPKDAADVVLEPQPELDDAEKALRDSSGKFNDQQKRHALYLLLARTNPTEEQQLWLTTLIDQFLQGS